MILLQRCNWSDEKVKTYWMTSILNKNHSHPPQKQEMRHLAGVNNTRTHSWSQFKSTPSHDPRQQENVSLWRRRNTFEGVLDLERRKICTSAASTSARSGGQRQNSSSWYVSRASIDWDTMQAKVKCFHGYEENGGVNWSETLKRIQENERPRSLRGSLSVIHEAFILLERHVDKAQ